MFSAASLTDPDVREAYLNPDSHLVGGDVSGDPPRRDAPCAGGGLVRKAELLELCRRLDAADILHLLPAEDAEGISSVFANRKKRDETTFRWILRLLFDRRVRGYSFGGV